jgi:type I restriction enzyme S subunit
MKTELNNKKLGEICRIRTGKKDVNQGNPDGVYPFFTCAAKPTFSDTYSFDTEALLIAGNGDVGRVSYYKGKFEVYQRTYVLTDFIQVLPRFLFYILDGTLKETVSGQKLGNTMPYIKIGMLSGFQIPIPSLPEQHRIIKILDEASEGIASAKANAEKNLLNARALFESYLNDVFTKNGEGWETKRLDEVCQIKPPKSEAKNHLKDDDFVSFAPMEYLGINQKYLKSPIKKKLDTVVGSYTYFAEGDVLLAKITPCFENGKLGIAKNLVNGIGFGSSEYIVMRPYPTVDKEFLYYFLLRQSFRDEGAQQMFGAVGQKRVSKEFIESYPICFPSIPNQKDIVKKLDNLHIEIQRLDSIYQQKINTFDTLKKSLLHKAFQGEL